MFFDVHQICSCLVVLVCFAWCFWWFVVGPLKAPLPVPLISIRFASVCACFGCFCLVVSLFLVRSPVGIPYHFYRFPSDLLVFWPEKTKRQGSIRQAMEKTPKKRTPKADRSEPAPGPNGRLLPERTKRQGSTRSLPAPSAEAAPRFAFWPAPGPNCLYSLSIYSRRVPKGKVLSVLSRHRRQKQHRDSHFEPAPGLNYL
jgi:hypothetical protein